LDTLNVVDPGLPGGMGTFMFNISDTIPSNAGSVFYTDFQRTLIHELGHVLQLRHTSNPSDMMATGSIVSPSFNNFNRNLSANDILGLKHIYLLSKLGACSDGAMTDYICTTNTSDFNEDISRAFVYPNPTQENLYFISKNPSARLIAEIWTLDGQRVFLNSYFNTGEPIEIDLPSNLPNGMYLIRVLDNEGQINGYNKIIIQR